MTTPSCVLLQSMRRILLTNSVPPPRLEIVSPYTDTTASEVPPSQPLYSKKQLDMRRKYEILQYKDNGVINGKRTKKVLYTNLMNNNRNRYTISVPENNGVTVYSTNACPDDDKIAVPTTSSGVPGPTEMIYYEPDVPLYMFGYQKNDYAILPKVLDKSNIAQIISNTNIPININQLTHIFTMIFNEYTPQGDQSINISIPMLINIIGSTTDIDSSVKVMISDYIVQILQAVQEINVDNMEIFLDNNEIIINDFDENGNFEINQEVIANIIYNFPIIPEGTMSVNIQPIFTIINGVINQISVLANPDGNNEFNVDLS
jgi:hypothetical protein